jgi:hypothetical protein
MREYSIADLRALLGDAVLAVHGPAGATFRRPASLGIAGPDCITFAKRLDDPTRALLARSRAGVVLCLEGAALTRREMAINLKPYAAAFGADGTKAPPA